MTDSRRGLLLCLSAALLFGVMVSSVKAASQQLEASEIVFIRFTFGLLAVLLPALRLLFNQGLHSPKLLLLRGVLGGSAVLAYFSAIGMIPAAMASLLNYTSPLYTTLLGVWFLNERPQSSVLGLGLVALCGCVLVAAGGVLQVNGAPLLGYGLAALSAVGAGSSIVAMRALGRSDHPILTFAALCVSGIVVSLPFASRWVMPSSHTSTWLLLMSLSSLAAQLLFTHGLRYISASVAALSMQLSVAVTAVLGFLLFDERPAPVQWAGATLILAGVVGIVLNDYRRKT